MDAWTRHETLRQRLKVERSPHVDRQGHASSLNNETPIVRVRPCGFGVREDWGEGNWTARDLR